MQGSKLYCGNLKYSVSDQQLEELFGQYGEVKSVNVIQVKGFGFIEMGTPEEAEKAKEALDGQDYEGRIMKVSEAHPPREKREFGPRRPE